MTKNIQESIILSDSTYERVLGMLTSPDKESVYIGVSIIEAVDLEENLPYILLLAKDCSKSNCNHDPFKNDVTASDDQDVVKRNSFSPSIMNYVNDCANDKGHLNFNSMYNVIKKNTKTSPAAMQFFLDKFSASLQEYLLTWGFDFVQEMNLKLIPKHVKQS